MSQKVMPLIAELVDNYGCSCNLNVHSDVYHLTIRYLDKFFTFTAEDYVPLNKELNDFFMNVVEGNI